MQDRAAKQDIREYSAAKSDVLCKILKRASWSDQELLDVKNVVDTKSDYVTLAHL